MSRGGSFVSVVASHKLVFGAVRAAVLECGSHSVEHFDIGEMQTELLASRQMRKPAVVFRAHASRRDFLKWLGWQRVDDVVIRHWT